MDYLCCKFQELGLGALAGSADENIGALLCVSKALWTNRITPTSEPPALLKVLIGFSEHLREAYGASSLWRAYNLALTAAAAVVLDDFPSDEVRSLRHNNRDMSFVQLVDCQATHLVGHFQDYVDIVSCGLAVQVLLDAQSMETLPRLPLLSWIARAEGLVRGPCQGNGVLLENWVNLLDRGLSDKANLSELATGDPCAAVLFSLKLSLSMRGHGDHKLSWRVFSLIYDGISFLSMLRVTGSLMATLTSSKLLALLLRRLKFNVITKDWEGNDVDNDVDATAQQLLMLFHDFRKLQFEDESFSLAALDHAVEIYTMVTFKAAHTGVPGWQPLLSRSELDAMGIWLDRLRQRAQEYRCDTLVESCQNGLLLTSDPFSYAEDPMKRYRMWRYPLIPPTDEDFLQALRVEREMADRVAQWQPFIASLNLNFIN